MKIFLQTLRLRLVLQALLLPFVFSTMLSAQQADSTIIRTTPIGTSKTWGMVDGITYQGLVQGPSAAVSQLQIACVFEYTEGDIFNPPALAAPLNGMVHLDEALKGQITELRKSGKFSGHALETILIKPLKGSLKAPYLILIGLGNRNDFSPDLMVSVGRVAYREALKLNVRSFSFASDLKDAGIDSPTALVAANVTRGIIEANRTQQYLIRHKLSVATAPAKVILLAGPAFFTTAGEGIAQAIGSFNYKSDEDE